MKIFNFKKNRILFKVLCTGLILLFSFQNSAYSIVRDLRDEGDISAFDVALAIISGYINGAALAEVEDVFKLSFLAKTYVLPVIASKVADKLGIENSIARAAFIMGFTAGIDAFANALQSGLKEGGKEVVKKAVKEANKKGFKKVIGKAAKTLEKSSIYKFFNSIIKFLSSIKNKISNFFGKIFGKPSQTQTASSGIEKLKKEGKEALKKKIDWKEALKIGARKAIQGAIQGAAEQAAYEMADEHLPEWWAEIMGDSVGLFVGEVVEIAETEITGEKISYDEEKGIVVEKKEEGYAKKEIKEFFKKFGIRMSPQFLAALAREIGGKKEWGIVGSVFGNALVEKLFIDKKKIAKLEAEIRKNDKAAPQEFTQETVTERIKGLNKEIKILENEVKILKNKGSLTNKEEQKLLQKLSKLKRLKSLRYYYQELNLSLRSFKQKLMDAFIYGAGGILLENVSRRMYSPVYGAYFNLFNTSLFKSGIDIFRGNIPYDGGIKGALGFIKDNLIYDAVRALTNFYSMGRLRPVRVLGRGTRFKFTPEITYNPFFIDRLADYVRMGEKHSYLDAIISQYVSSLHAQSMLNLYQSYLLLTNQLNPVYVSCEKLLRDLGIERKLRKYEWRINEILNELKKINPELAKEIERGLEIAGIKIGEEVDLSPRDKWRAISQALLKSKPDRLRDALEKINQLPSSKEIKEVAQLVDSLNEYISTLKNYQRRDGYVIAPLITNLPNSSQRNLYEKFQENYNNKPQPTMADKFNSNYFAPNKEIEIKFKETGKMYLYEDPYTNPHSGKITSFKPEIVSPVPIRVEEQLLKKPIKPQTPPQKLPPPEIQREPIKIVELKFWYDEKNMYPSSERALNEVLSNLSKEELEKKKIIIHLGKVLKHMHDSIGSKERNLELALNRANEVKDKIVNILKKKGIKNPEELIEIKYNPQIYKEKYKNLPSNMPAGMIRAEQRSVIVEIKGETPTEIKRISPKPPVEIKPYVVKKEDTLLGIVKKFEKQGYKTTVNQIIHDNDLQNPNKLEPGQRLYISVEPLDTKR